MSLFFLLFETCCSAQVTYKADTDIHMTLANSQRKHSEISVTNGLQRKTPPMEFGLTIILTKMKEEEIIRLKGHHKLINTEHLRWVRHKGTNNSLLMRYTNYVYYQNAVVKHSIQNVVRMHTDVLCFYTNNAHRHIIKNILPKHCFMWMPVKNVYSKNHSPFGRNSFTQSIQENVNKWGKKVRQRRQNCLLQAEGTQCEGHPNQCTKHSPSFLSNHRRHKSMTETHQVQSCYTAMVLYNGSIKSILYCIVYVNILNVNEC